MTDFTIKREQVEDGMLLRIRYDYPLTIVELVFSESELVSCKGQIQSSAGSYKIAKLTDLEISKLPIESRRSIRSLITHLLGTSEDIEFVRSEFESSAYYVHVNENIIDVIVKNNHIFKAAPLLNRILTEVFNQNSSQADLISSQLLETEALEYRSSSRVW